MATMLYKTKGNSTPQGKPRVYFTCHSEDFDKYFSKICDDIFRTHDCAIYYTADMTEAIQEDDKETDLGSNNLFVIPVTFKLLTTPNRAMEEDFRYAKKEHIPVLPIMMEPGIDDFYSNPDKFGEIQYLNPYSTDLTEISYEDKLKKYLESVLISDEMAQRVRAAFDAYIFLSYRKKDRRYANELMRLIHQNPECRDIAIWFDEFLTPGESFKENIEKMLSDSKLFTLLVTPNLLEEPDGKPNFVMGEEYPAAKKSGIDILPAEMEATDKDELKAKFDDLPECVNPKCESEAFKLRLVEALSKIAVTANDSDPMHNFLIGIAYLEGIDVEIDRERGLELITSAAEENLPEAMKKLYKMYLEGIGVPLDYEKALKWAEKLADYNTKNLGEEHPDTLISLNNLAVVYGDVENYTKALELSEKTYIICCKVFDEEHPDALTSLNTMASSYGQVGNHTKALELGEKVYNLCCKVLGEEHPHTLSSLNNLALSYGDVGNHTKALELSEKAYTLCYKVLGEEHPYTLTLLNNLASSYRKVKNCIKALELSEKVYDLCYKVLGEEHPHTLSALNNLASSYRKVKNYTKALELSEKIYNLRYKVLGEEHFRTLDSLSTLAATYRLVGKQTKAIRLLKKSYELHCKVLGKDHEKTRTVMKLLMKAY